MEDCTQLGQKASIEGAQKVHIRVGKQARGYRWELVSRYR